VIARGEAPGPHIARHACFPPDFVSLYQTGETTAQLEQNLFRLAELNQERANTSLKVVSLLYPGLALVGVIILVGYNLISFYSGYLNMLGDLSAP
jgi:general secretion pathway protein F/type IV pilus assembly protein PilC